MKFAFTKDAKPFELSRDKTKEEFAEMKSNFEDIVSFILDLRVKGDKGSYYWISKLKENDQIYLGATHGLAGIVLFLTQVSKMGLDLSMQQEIDASIKGACKYIKLQQYEKEHPLVFPIIVGELKYTKIYPKNYCYGDFTTIYGLFNGYNHLDDAKGLKYVKDCFKLAESKGFDAPYLDAGKSLLYGHAGTAMVSRNLFLDSGDKKYLSLYHNRVDYLISQFDPEDEYLGFKGYWNQGIPHVNFSFFEGLIGIAIELLCSIDSKRAYNHSEFFFLK